MRMPGWSAWEWRFAGQAVRDIRAEGAQIGEEFIKAGTMVWGAGIAASPVARWLGIDSDRIGRVPVRHNLAVEGVPEAAEKTSEAGSS
jgi:NADH dehydrogenase FAD-containing subunit